MPQEIDHITQQAVELEQQSILLFIKFVQDLQKILAQESASDIDGKFGGSQIPRLQIIRVLQKTKNIDKMSRIKLVKLIKKVLEKKRQPPKLTFERFVDFINDVIIGILNFFISNPLDEDIQLKNYLNPLLKPHYKQLMLSYRAFQKCYEALKTTLKQREQLTKILDQKVNKFNPTPFDLALKPFHTDRKEQD